MTKKIALFLITIIILAVGGIIIYLNLPAKKVEKTEVSLDQSLKIVKERGILIVGADVPYGMMEYFDEDGKIVGFDIDIINEVAKRMGVGIEIRDIDWDNLFTTVKSGEIDVAISVIAITEERKKEMLFSTPYMNAGQTIVVLKNNESVKGPKDLMGKKVGAQKNTTIMEEAIKYSSPELLTGYDSYEEEDGSGIFKDLKKGKLDAVVISYEAAIGTVRKDPSLKIACDPFTNEFGGIVTKLGNNSLIAEIDRALRDMNRDGVLKDFEKNWMTAN